MIRHNNIQDYESHHALFASETYTWLMYLKMVLSIQYENGR